MEWLSSKDVAARLCVARSTVYEWMDRYDFPRPVKHGGKRRWVAAEVDAWLVAQTAARNV